VLKWPVDAEKCLQGWVKQKVSCCGTCLRVCPFNKEEGWLHDLVRWGIEHLPFLNKFFVWADGALGYHKQLPPEKFWTKEDKE
jgi:ferredoxin